MLRTICAAIALAMFQMFPATAAAGVSRVDPPIQDCGGFAMQWPNTDYAWKDPPFTGAPECVWKVCYGGNSVLGNPACVVAHDTTAGGYLDPLGRFGEYYEAKCHSWWEQLETDGHGETATGWNDAMYCSTLTPGTPAVRHFCEAQATPTFGNGKRTLSSGAIQTYAPLAWFTNTSARWSAMYESGLHNSLQHDSALVPASFHCVEEKGPLSQPSQTGSPWWCDDAKHPDLGVKPVPSANTRAEAIAWAVRLWEYEDGAYIADTSGVQCTETPPDEPKEYQCIARARLVWDITDQHWVEALCDDSGQIVPGGTKPCGVMLQPIPMWANNAPEAAAAAMSFWTLTIAEPHPDTVECRLVAGSTATGPQERWICAGAGRHARPDLGTLPDGSYVHATCWLPPMEIFAAQDEEPHNLAVEARTHWMMNGYEMVSAQLEGDMAVVTCDYDANYPGQPLYPAGNNYEWHCYDQMDPANQTDVNARYPGEAAKLALEDLGPGVYPHQVYCNIVAGQMIEGGEGATFLEVDMPCDLNAGITPSGYDFECVGLGAGGAEVEETRRPFQANTLIEAQQLWEQWVIFSYGFDYDQTLGVTGMKCSAVEDEENSNFLCYDRQADGTEIHHQTYEHVSHYQALLNFYESYREFYGHDPYEAICDETDPGPPTQP